MQIVKVRGVARVVVGRQGVVPQVVVVRPVGDRMVEQGQVVGKDALEDLLVVVAADEAGQVLSVLARVCQDAAGGQAQGAVAGYDGVGDFFGFG